MDSSTLSQLEYKLYNYSRCEQVSFITKDDNNDIKYFTCLIEIPTGHIGDNFISFINLDVFFNRLIHIDFYKSREKFKICGAHITDLKSFKLKGVADPTTNFNSFSFPQFTKFNPLITSDNDYLYVGVKIKCELSELCTLDVFKINIIGNYCEIPKDIHHYLNYSNQFEYLDGYVEMNYNEPTEYELISFLS
ncbi:hypothetical protein QJ850_gp393 [Acanthamoeba polyphaga mimivirus]|uniref:Uncharacterized protein n=1 Tax=Acanthamoeba polyphaga mimivirus Kroon TaxID=3069720 RepID=A0A0G2YB43_9VIRU|nr:hypothetical protein QJ850_gp393 [Acanthamoeba polyphaga mimivirus]AKI80306.1 hypothetical protein [Acanthamoeba polyphaga mimivirus Kroon]